MKLRVLIAFFVAGILAVSCRQMDIRTVVIHVPEMKNRACADIVVGAVSRLPGIERDKTVVDVAGRYVAVTYDSLILGLKNIEFIIAGAGFTANDVPAKPEAVKKLPPGCRPAPAPPK